MGFSHVLFKYGYGQWVAIKYAISQNPNFRFDYFLRSLPITDLSRRCEQLMKAAEKEVEHLEKAAREFANLPTEPIEEGRPLPPIEIPPYKLMRKLRKEAAKTKAEAERSELESKVIDIAAQIKEKQQRLKALNEGSLLVDESNPDQVKEVETEGFVGPNGEFVAFPTYDGSSEPIDWKKPFGQFCSKQRRVVKATLSDEQKKDKVSIQIWGNISHSFLCRNMFYHC